MFALSTARSRRHKRDRRGSVVVEYAFALPVLLLIFFGMWEWSRAQLVRQAITTAAYEAAREAIIPGATEGEARTRANEVINAARVNNATVDITPLTPSTPVVTVSIEASMNDNSWMPPFFYRDKTMSARFSLQREGFE